MPVSHLGLTVSHIPSATSFYLASLQPLGYHYIGQRGDSIGLGVVDADFYLTQDTRGLRRAPTHIAFRADTRLAVRDCYAAALNAGGKPSGAPGYTDPDGLAFNAAVEDLDGNTLEIIFREPISLEEHPPPAIEVPKSVAASRNHASHAGHKSVASGVTSARSRAQTVTDVVSATSAARRKSDTPANSRPPPPPSQGISRAVTSPAMTPSSNFPTKKVFGTILGAAAGAAFAYAMTHAEAENARDERDFDASTRDKSPGRKSHVRSRREVSEPPRSTDRRRNYSVTESARSRYPPPSTMRTIQAGGHDDDEVQEAIRRHQASSRRPQPRRSRTLGAIEYAPAPPYTERESQYTVKRSSTLPVDVSKHSHDAPKPRSSVSHSSRHSARHSSHEESNLSRHDSVVNVPSHRSPRSRPSTSSRRQSEASTVKPWPASGQRNPAAEVPLPSSRAASSYPPPAKVQSPPSYVSTAKIPLPQSRADGWEDTDDSDGLGDCKTVVPDDSISCVGFKNKPRHRRASSRQSGERHGSRRSEADSERTVRPAKAGRGERLSAFTLPGRAREDPYGQERGRKTYSHA